MPSEPVSGPNNEDGYDEHANVKSLVKEKESLKKSSNTVPLRWDCCLCKFDNHEAMVYCEICGASPASVPKESVDGIPNNSGTPAQSNSDSTKLPVTTLSTNLDHDSDNKHESTAHDKVKSTQLASVARSSGTGKKMQREEYKPEEWMEADQESWVDKTVAVSKKCREFHKKLENKLALRENKWKDFMNPSEKQLLDSYAQRIENQQCSKEEVYMSILDKLKMIEKKINTRIKEHQNLLGSWSSLINCVENLCFVQSELHKEDCAKARLAKAKVEQQQSMESYEDPIILSRDLDSLRKKIQTLLVPPVEIFSSTEIEDLTFNAETEDLESFIHRLRSRFADHAECEKILECSLLPSQTPGEQPPKWFRVRLIGRRNSCVFIYLRADNGYFVGFENQHGMFELGPGLRSELTRLLPNSTFVQCDADYPAMVNYSRSGIALEHDEVQRRLMSIRLDIEAMLANIEILSEYSHPLALDAIGSFQVALAGTAIMICEVSRIHRISMAVVCGWRTGANLNELFLEYIWRWKLICKALRQWRTNRGKKFSEKLQDLVKMVYAIEARDVLRLVLNRKVGVYHDDDSDDDDDGEQPPKGTQPPEGSSKQPPKGTQPPPEGTQPPEGSTKQLPEGKQPPHDAKQHNDDGDEPVDERYSTPSQGNSSPSSRRYPYRRNHGHVKGLMHIVPYGQWPIANYQGSKPLSFPDHGQANDVRLSPKPYPFSIFLESYSFCSPSQGFSDVIQLNLNNRSIIHNTGLTSWSLNNHIERILEVNSRPAISPIPTMASLTGTLVEICEVYANFPFVGTILVCDEHSSKSLFYRDDWTTAYRDFMLGRHKWVSTEGNAAVDFKDKLKLTGPYRATTADSGFVIKVCTPATKRKSREICKIECNGSNSRTCSSLKTSIMKMDRGCLFVTYSVMPEALQASLVVSLRLPLRKCYPGAKVYGHITAVIDNFGIASTLFSKDAKEAVPLGEQLKETTLMGPYHLGENEGYKTMRLPLARSVMAVPFGERLQMMGKLQLCLDDAPSDIKDDPIDINYSLWIGEEECETLYYRRGDSFTNVRMSLRPVF